MHDSLFVCRRQSPRHLQRVVNRLAAGKRSVPDPLPQRLPFQQFGNDIGSAALLPNIENRKNVRMIQCRRRASFLHESLQPLRIRRVRRGQNLDGHNAIKPRVASPIHLAHTSRTDQRLDVVRAEFRAGSECHLKLWIISDSRVSRYGLSRRKIGNWRTAKFVITWLGDESDRKRSSRASPRAACSVAWSPAARAQAVPGWHAGPLPPPACGSRRRDAEYADEPRAIVPWQPRCA